MWVLRECLLAAFVVAAAGVCVKLSAGGDGRRDIQKAHVTGVLVDQATGTRALRTGDPEEAAAQRAITSLPDSSDATEYGIVSGDRFLRFDPRGNTLAREFFATHPLHRATVEGERDGEDFIRVTSILPEPDNARQGKVLVAGK